MGEKFKKRTSTNKSFFSRNKNLLISCPIGQVKKNIRRRGEKSHVPDEKLARALRAKQRRDILHVLRDDKERTVQEIAHLVHLSLTSASKHLRLLADYGILKVNQDPPYKYYSIQMPEIKDLVKLYDEIVKKIK